MAVITLVRHGQARFEADDYDQLSYVGWQQGHLLGRALRNLPAPALVFGGSLKRHCETVEAIASGYGATLPDMQILEGLNEFDHQDVLARYRPEWRSPSAMRADLREEPHPGRAFQQAFTAAMERWVSGQPGDSYRESWPAFCARIEQALADVLALAGGGDVLVVTSGGPITVILRQLLELSDSHALALNPVIANASVSRVLYSGDRRTLSVFNNFAHLEAEDPTLVTYR